MITFQSKHCLHVSSVWKRAIRTLPVLGIFAALPLFAQLSPICGTNELHHLGRAMAAMNMTTEDFNFDKDHGEPKSSLPWIREALNHPLMMPVKGDELLKAAAESDDAIWKVGRELLDIRGPIVYSQGHALRPWNDLDSKLGEGLQNFTVASQQAAHFVKQSFAALTDEEKTWLAATAFSDLLRVQRGDLTAQLRASGISDAVISRVSAEENAFDPEPATTNFLAVAAKLDRGALLHAGATFQSAIKSLAAVAATVSNWPAAGAMFETEYGPIIILPPGDHIVTNRALLILSRAGNTTYRSASSNFLPPGAANGLLGQPLSVIIDLGGDDQYGGGDSVGPGGALFGVSAIYDMAGDDEYKAHYLGDGGAIFGVAWVEDAKGNDHHDAWGIAQGAAVCGLAVLRDREGNDSYSVGQLGQGFAGFQGCGLLIEDTGTDRYFAGGREQDWGRGGERFLSLSQGFSIGIRGFAGGGVGALIDRGGNDNYTADVYGQGASYWYSAGFLLDVAGNDNYTVHQYGQGTGIHLSLGLLADFAGDDRYTGYILSQGSGHDYGVGFLFDRAGDDTYVADHHSQGRALNNALGVLVDSAGGDAYFARQNNRAQGIGNNGDNREYGSVAILADLAGNDQYSSGAKNDDRTERPLFGIIYDFSTNAPFAKEATK